MACKSCGKRRRRTAGLTTASSTAAVSAARRASNAISQQTTFSGADFETKFYIGESGEVLSVLPQLSYGKRETNQQMFVHIKDLESNPELWADDKVVIEKRRDDFTTLNGVGEKTAQKFYDHGIITFEQLKGMSVEQLKEYTKADLLSQLE